MTWWNHARYMRYWRKLQVDKNLCKYGCGRPITKYKICLKCRIKYANNRNFRKMHKANDVKKA